MFSEEFDKLSAELEQLDMDLLKTNGELLDIAAKLLSGWYMTDED